MKHLRKIVAELLGFDRRERRGTFVLVVMVALLLLVRVFAFRPDTGHLDYNIISSAQTDERSSGQAEASSAPLFTFDPNTASHADLLNLGLTERQAQTLINYRSSGARFRRPEDLLRVYGIDSATSARLVPWIIITAQQESAGPVRRNPDHDSAGEHPHEAAAVTAVAPIDLNMCTAADLLLLPGIGPVLSERIIRYRSLLGGFVDTGQLSEVYGLDSQVVVLISPMLMLTYDSVTPLVLDSCSFSQMARHPYVGSSAARLISKYRSLMKTPVTLGDLVGQKVLSHEQAVRLAPYVRPSPDASGGEYEFILSKVLK